MQGFTSQSKDQYGFSGENTPHDEIRIAEATILAGSIFNGATGLTPTTGTTGTDPNFWTGTNANSATIVQTGAQVTLSTLTNSAASAILQSVRSARFLSSISLRFRASLSLGDIGLVNNTRRWGAFNGTDGAYFELAGTTLTACTLRTGVRNPVQVLNAPTTALTSYEIYYLTGKVYFVISGTLVATHNASAAPWTDFLTLPCRVDNINSGNTTNTTIIVRTMSIARLGKLSSETIYKNITGVSASQILKYSAGRLHRIVVGTPVNGKTITIYDNVTGTSNIIGVITCPSSLVPLSIEYNLPFYIGLNIVPNDNNLNTTIIYE